MMIIQHLRKGRVAITLSDLELAKIIYFSSKLTSKGKRYLRKMCSGEKIGQSQHQFPDMLLEVSRLKGDLNYRL
jgi:hypothetical protein